MNNQISSRFTPTTDLKTGTFVLIPNFATQKEFALRDLTQLYSFLGLKIVQKNSDNEQNQNTDKHMKSKPTQQKRISSANIS